MRTTWTKRLPRPSAAHLTTTDSEQALSVGASPCQSQVKLTSPLSNCTSQLCQEQRDKFRSLAILVWKCLGESLSVSVVSTTGVEVGDLTSSADTKLIWLGDTWNVLVTALVSHERANDGRAHGKELTVFALDNSMEEGESSALSRLPTHNETFAIRAHHNCCTSQ